MRSLVAKKVAEDAAAGGENADIATKLNGLITRKVVKQTVMTSVYGVTFVGAKRQVENRRAPYPPSFLVGVISSGRSSRRAPS